MPRYLKLVAAVYRTFMGAVVLRLAAPCLAAAQENRPPIARLDDATRAKVLSALAGLIILGFAMVLLTWLGARLTQRYRRGTTYFRPTARPGEHDWAREPLDSDSN